MVSSLGALRSRVLGMAGGGRLTGWAMGGLRLGSGGRGVLGGGDGGVGPRPVPAPLPSPKTR